MKNSLLGTVSLVALIGSMSTAVKADDCSNGGSGNTYTCSGAITTPQNLSASGGNLIVSLSGIVSTSNSFSGNEVFALNGNGYDVSYTGGANGTSLTIPSASYGAVISASTSGSGSISLTNSNGNNLAITNVNPSDIIRGFNSSGSGDVTVTNSGTLTGNGIANTGGISASSNSGAANSLNASTGNINITPGSASGSGVQYNSTSGVLSYTQTGSVTASNQGNIDINSSTGNLVSTDGSASYQGFGVIASIMGSATGQPVTAQNDGSIIIRNGNVSAAGSTFSYSALNYSSGISSNSTNSNAGANLTTAINNGNITLQSGNAVSSDPTGIAASASVGAVVMQLLGNVSAENHGTISVLSGDTNGYHANSAASGINALGNNDIHILNSGTIIAQSGIATGTNLSETMASGMSAGGMNLSINIGPPIPATGLVTATNSGSITASGLRANGIDVRGSIGDVTLTNSGTITTSVGTGAGILGTTTTAALTASNQSGGVINSSGVGFELASTTGNITATNDGSIHSTGDGIFINGSGNNSVSNTGNINATSGSAIHFLDSGSGGTESLINSGSLIGSTAGVITYGGAVFNSGINNTGTISATSGSGLMFQSGASITGSGIVNTGTISGTTGGVYTSSNISAINNSGIISATSGDAITLNASTVGSITNTGSISGSGYGINNSNGGTITSITNAQGGNGSTAATTALTYTGVLPTSYTTLISSTNRYGQLSVTGASGSMTFSIDNSSTVEGTTYLGVLQGFSSLSGITGTTGTFNGMSYSFALDTTRTGFWNLVFASNNIAPGTTTDASNLGNTPALSGGTLDMNQSNTTYSQTFTVASTASTINQSGNTSTFSGDFTNANGQTGNLIISNTGNGGKVIFTGANTYSGSTTISNGATVAVNGSMVSNMIVNSGGILQGNGSFGGGSINGILAPGNSIGTITSNGNLTFGSGSIYAVEVNAAGASDKLVVNGATTIQGGTVAVSGNLSSPAYLPKQKYTILTSTQGVSGRFSGVSGLPSLSFLTAGLSYGANDVTLGFNFATPFSVVGKNINQRNVGNALTLAALGPVNALGAPILNALFLGNFQNAQAVMDTVSGSGLAGVQSTAMQVGEMASSAVSDQIAFWRSGETYDATGVTSQEGNNPRSFMAYAPVEANVKGRGPINIKGPSQMAASVTPRTYRAWGSMFGGGANYLSDAGRGSAASNLGYYGGLVGVDYQVQPNLLIGAALGGSSANFNVGSLSTNGSLTGFHAGLYGSYTMGASYVALNETFSAYNNQTTRKAGGYAMMPYEQLSAGFGSTEFRTRLEGGHTLLMGGLKATPFVAGEIAAYQSNYFAEKSTIVASTFALKNNGQSVNSLPTFIGLRLSNGYTLANGWRLAPIGSVAYVHEFFPQRQLNNMLMSMPGADFNVSGPRSTYNLVQTKLGAQLNLTKQFALFTDFQGEFSSMSQSYGGKAGLKYWW